MHARRLLILFPVLISLSACSKKHSSHGFDKQDPNAKTSTEYKCNFKDVSSVQLPLYPERSDSPKFEYRYQVIGKLNANKPAIVYLPGGPGGSSISDYDQENTRNAKIRSGLPADLPWIFFDGRTVGCNRGDKTKFPDDSLTTNYLAGDVIGVLKHLGVKDYVIVAYSYGTQWATVVAGRAARGEISEPRAIVIGGVLGRGEPDGSFAVSANLKIQWDLILRDLPSKVVDKISVTTPLGYSDRTWMKYISSRLYNGTMMIRGEFTNALHNELMGLNSDDPKDYSDLTWHLDYYSEYHPYLNYDFSDRLYQKIDCHEFSPVDGGSLFSKGKVFPNSEDTGCGEETFDRPFDSAQWLSHAPTYYLAGTNDPAAPYIGAYYHFEHQTGARRNFIKVPGGGHNNLGNILPDCLTPVWASILKQEDLSNALKSCKAPVVLTVRAAGK